MLRLGFLVFGDWGLGFLLYADYTSEDFITVVRALGLKHKAFT